ncbi:MAG: SDR family oxidoreductase, partial [Armatimonadota bacterium]
AAVAALPAYADDYKAYYDAWSTPDSPARRGAEPAIVLVPGVGMLAFGRTAAEARITGEFYVNAIHVMEGATAMAGVAPISEDIDPKLVEGNYVSLPPLEAFKIEYWALEEAKLRRMPPEREMARTVAIVFGSGPGIGRSVARRCIEAGAVAVCADLSQEIAEDSAQALRDAYGPDAAIGVACDITDRESVRAALHRAALAYGGIDTAVVTAAIFFPPDEHGDIADSLFRRTLEVNLTGNFIAAHESGRFLEQQGIGGSLVLVSSANAVVPKKGGIAYDTGKTALNHMIREMAMTFAPAIRVNGVAPASVVSGSLMFPRHRVESSLDKYGLPHAPDESDDVLRDRLSEFYAQRTLLKRPVTPVEVTEAIYLLASKRLPLTTGCIVPVDAGLPEAFLR